MLLHTRKRQQNTLKKCLIGSFMLTTYEAYQAACL